MIFIAKVWDIARTAGPVSLSTPLYDELHSKRQSSCEA